MGIFNSGGKICSGLKSTNNCCVFGQILGIFLFVLIGCGGEKSGSLLFFKTGGFPFPIIDSPIGSVKSYNKMHGIDLYSKSHDIHDEIDFTRKYAERSSKIWNSVRSPGEKKLKPFFLYDHFTKSKKVGKNDYLLKLRNIKPIETQKGEELCWAACIQYIIWDKSKRTIDQNELAKLVHKHSDSKDKPATVLDMMSTLGYTDTRVSENGAWHILETLGFGHPTVMGLLPNCRSSIGHVVVVVGARYSFTDERNHIFSSKHSGIAFSKLAVLDPSSNNGKPKWIEVSQVEDRIGFILSFDYIPAAQTY